MCPDNQNEFDPESTQPIPTPGAAPTPPDEPSMEDATLAQAPAAQDSEDATIALPAEGARPATATNPATSGDTTGGIQNVTGGGSVPFTPVRDMTSGTLEKVKAKKTSGGARSVGHRFANRFEVVDVLGEGGMGKVFRVRDTQIDNREMALKVLRPKYSNNKQFRQLFTKEIHAAQNFVSEHVVQIRDTGQTADNQLFLTMDMVDGEDLHDTLKREGALLPRHALEIIRQTLLGLHSGHEQGFIHRDIKPSNVMLSSSVPKTDQNPYGVGVQLLDFGIAGIAAEVSGQVAGTPMYMSPEQAQGQRLDVRSDLFTVGVMMFEMLSGARPFEGKTLEDVITSILEADISTMIGDLPQLGRPLQKILTKALQKDREKRYQNAQEFIQAIEKSKAFKINSQLPAGTALLLGVSVLATIGQAAFIWSTKDEGQGLQTEIASLKGDLNKERTSRNTELDSAKEKHRLELVASEKQFNSAKGQLTKDLADSKKANDDLTIQLEKKEAKVTGLLKDLTDKVGVDGKEDTRIQVQDAAMDSLKRELSDVKEQLKDQEVKAENQAEELRKLQRDTQPEAQAAKGFDRIMQWIDHGRPARARKEFAQLNEVAIFSGDSIDGGSLVLSLVHASEFIAEFEVTKDAGEPDPAALTKARHHLDQAQANISDFALASQDWFEKETESIGQQQRSENLDGLFISLATKITDHEGEMNATFKAEFDTILAGAATQDPTRAFQLVNVAPANFIDGLLAKYAEALLSDFESAGELDVQALANLGTLDTWVQFLEGSASGNGQAFNPGHVATLRVFRTAQIWHTGTDQDRQGLTHALETPTIPAGPALNDWRASLALEMALYQSNAYPLPKGRVAVYLQTNKLNGSQVWIIAKGLETEGDGKEYVSERRPFKIDQYGGVKALSKSKTTTRFANWKYQYAEEEVLDLIAANSNVQVVNWDRLAAQALPNDGSFPSASKQASFREAFGASSHPCLVQIHDEYTGWYSPTHGLVHYEKGNVVRDLVYLAN